MLPLVAGALLVDGTVHTHTSVRGDLVPDLHPVIRRFLHELPTDQRERYLGRCAEAVLLSDRLYAAERAGDGEVSQLRARSLLWGARMRLSRVGEPGDPTHGTSQPPCRSCAALLDWLGVEVIP
ncbi:YwqJ-related putative deaminase [Plantactinospora siamensis]|uniref:YwqJ-related putative deaminase n=1 Tax=Plantactinospora siamensis TaxID=555372 RepID=A0ABV6NQ40_9ACTN